MIRSGRKTVTTAGTAERLAAASTPADWLLIQAEANNTGEVVLGDSLVVAAEATRQGLQLNPAISVELMPILIRGPLDLTDLWLDVSVNTDGTHFIYMERT
jgi:hypothetical protein